MTPPTEPVPVTLEEAPIGLFRHGDTIALKTEYRHDGMIDAYIVSSGEAFWGPAPQTAESQRKCLVVPIDFDALVKERDEARRVVDAARGALRLTAERHNNCEVDSHVSVSRRPGLKWFVYVDSVCPDLTPIGFDDFDAALAHAREVIAARSTLGGPR